MMALLLPDVLSILLAGSYAGHSLSLFVGVAGAALPGPWAGEVAPLFCLLLLKLMRCGPRCNLFVCVWRLFVFGSGRCLGSTYVT